MASVHVQYESVSDDCAEKDEYTGTDGDDGGDRDSNDEASHIHSDDDDGDESADDESRTDSHSPTKSGLADAMSKILRKSVPRSKQVVLERGQTDREIQRKRKTRSDVTDNKTDKSKRRKSTASEDTESDDENPDAYKNYRERGQQRKEWEEMARVKPSVLEKDIERGLQKIATRGVVQLFNAVRQQQSMLGEKLAEVGSSERRREKVLSSANKKNFLTLLDNTTRSTASLGLEVNSKTDRNKSQATRRDDEPDARSGSWSILRDDFMLGAKMKDWDRAGDSDGEDGGLGGNGDLDNEVMSDSE